MRCGTCILSSARSLVVHKAPDCPADVPAIRVDARQKEKTRCAIGLWLDEGRSFLRQYLPRSIVNEVGLNEARLVLTLFVRFASDPFISALVESSDTCSIGQGTFEECHTFQYIFDAGKLSRHPVRRFIELRRKLSVRVRSKGECMVSCRVDLFRLRLLRNTFWGIGKYAQ